MTRRLTLERDHWYGWQMLPGYSSGGEYRPYFSPIFMKKAEPLKTGKGWLRLQFINAGYAAGVQDFSLALRVLDRRESFLVGRLEDGARNAIISVIDFQWIRSFTSLSPQSKPDPDGTTCQAYLNQTFFRTLPM
jgi:hypothetical protein